MPKQQVGHGQRQPKRRNTDQSNNTETLHTTATKKHLQKNAVNKQKKSTKYRKKSQHNYIVLYNVIPSAQTIVCARDMAQQAF